MFTGLDAGSGVTPLDVGVGTLVQCPTCKRQMETKPTTTSNHVSPRHFSHPDGECAHELDTDAVQLTVAASTFSARLQTQVQPLRHLPSIDCAGSFDTTANRFGDGVLIFIVDSIDGKYVRPVTDRVNDAGFTAMWVSRDAYSTHNLHVDFSECVVAPEWARNVPNHEKWLAPMWTPSMEFGGTPMLTEWEYEIPASFPVEWFPETVSEALEDPADTPTKVPNPTADIPDGTISDACAEGEHSIVSDPRTPIGWVCEECGCSVQSLTDFQNQQVSIQ